MPLKINGGNPLRGRIQIEPNKNAVLPVLCETILTKYDCILKNTPKSPDVLKILEAIRGLGGTFSWEDGDRTLRVNCAGLQPRPVSDCVADIQSAILFAGPLLARFGEADLPVAIGCKLGYRGPEDHIYYLSKFGVDCSVVKGRVKFRVDRQALRDGKIVQVSPETVTKSITYSQASVTPTENLLMFLTCVTKFNVEVHGIAQEPHVEYMTNVLRKMGALIDGKGSFLVAKGCFGDLKGFECDFANEPDHVDFYGTAVTAALTGGRVKLLLKVTPAIAHMVEFLQGVGIHVTIERDGIDIDGDRSRFDPAEGFAKANDATWKMNPAPWPGFPVDSFPSFVALSCSNRNHNMAMTMNNWMYEDGIGYVRQLAAMRDNIVVFGNEVGEQKILVKWVMSKEFFNKEGDVTLDGVPVIEGTRALVSAALSRKGTTIIKDIAPLLRRAPDFVKKYTELGANLEIIS